MTLLLATVVSVPPGRSLVCDAEPSTETLGAFDLLLPPTIVNGFFVWTVWAGGEPVGVGTLTLKRTGY